MARDDLRIRRKDINELIYRLRERSTRAVVESAGHVGHGFLPSIAGELEQLRDMAKNKPRKPQP